jgi:hypothetical protein
MPNQASKPVGSRINFWSRWLVAALFAAAGLAVASPSEFSLLNAPIANRQYVVARDGHFFVGTTRLRFVGFNVQAGVYPTYPMINQVADRIAALGMNSVRLWPNEGTFYTEASIKNRSLKETQQGDGSALDRYDYFVAEFKKRGIYIMNPALHHMDVPTIRAWPDPEVHAIATATHDNRRLRDLHTIAPYLSPAYEKMVATHFANYLNHRNSYTGKRYAEEEVFAGWELANESKYVECLFSRVCLAGLPDILQRQLLSLWERACGQENCGRSIADLPPFSGTWNQVDEARHRQYREFVVRRFIEVSRHLEASARSLAQGAGVAVQPFNFNTHSGAPLLAAQVAHASGDYVAIGAYQTPTTNNHAAPYAPWSPFLTRFPTLFNFNFGAVTGKPLVVYETSFFRPYPYRSEWAAVMLALATSQDWDAIYLYMFGQPRFTFRQDENGNIAFGQVDLPTPSSMNAGDGRDYTSGFHHGGDEVVMASWMIAAAGMLRTPPAPAANEVHAQFGRRQIFGLPPGYCADASGCRSGVAATNAITRLNDLSAAGQLRLVFDLDHDLAGLDSCLNCAAATSTARAYPLNANAVWDSTRVMARFDTPNFKAVFGELRGTVLFSGGVSLDFDKPIFGCAGVWAEDGKPIIASVRVRLVTCGLSENQGFGIDPARIRFDSPYGAIAGVTNPGRNGVQITRPGVVLRYPGLRAQVKRFDFSFKVYGNDAVTGMMRVDRQEPFFSGVILRNE